MKRPFSSDLVITEQISDPFLKAYHVGFDQQKFRLTPLVDVIRNVIPEFSLGYHCGTMIGLTSMVEKLKEAAEIVYMTDKYQKRGEFGELILHLLLRDFRNTIPLISKMYFKDNHDVPAHGFDGVQISIEGSIKKLWLGESKLYKSGEAGISDLLNDIKKHVNEDYIRREFSLISKKLPESIPEIEYWRNLMDKHQRLDVIFDGIVIPMLCTYNSSIFTRHTDNTRQYFIDFENECKELFEKFDNKRPASQVEIILLLLPVPSKDELNNQIHKRLKAIQEI